MFGLNIAFCAEPFRVYEEIVGAKLASYGGKIGKHEINTMKGEWVAMAAARFEDIPANRLDTYYEHRMDQYVHDLAIEKGTRVDGRRFDEVRPLFA